MHSPFYETDLTNVARPGLRQFCRWRDRAADRAPPTFGPSSTPSLPPADRLPVAIVATRNSTVRHGLPLLSSLATLRCVSPSTSRALRAGPAPCRTGSLSIGGNHGWH